MTSRGVRRLAWAMVAIMGMGSWAGTALADELGRRGILGVRTQPAADGVTIAEVVNPAAADLLKVGDLVTAVAGRPATDWANVAAALQGLKAGTPVELTIRRDGAVQTLSVPTMKAPLPQLNGKPLELSAVKGEGGALMRTMLARPGSQALTRNGRVPAVMIIQGINCGSVEAFNDPTHPYTVFFRGLTEAGFVAYMVDKPGNGDSQGSSCETAGFNEEMAAYNAALAALAADPEVDPARLYAVGISMGGVNAPLLSMQTPLAGIVTWGTSAMPWYDYLLSSFRKRAYLMPGDYAALEQLQRAWRGIAADLFIDGQTIEQSRAERPEAFAIVEPAFGDLSQGFATRAWRFHLEADGAPLSRAWAEFKGSLLALHGEFDWVADRAEHELAVTLVNTMNPGRATFEIIPGHDHGMTKHASLIDSFARPFQGEPDDAVARRAIAWLTEQAGK